MNVSSQDRTPFIFTWFDQPEDAKRVPSSEPIITDRPSFTDSSRPVGANVTQLELGYTYSRNHSGSAHQSSHSYPEVGIRQGFLTDWLELRFTQSFVVSDSPADPSPDDNYFEVGTRLGITPQYGLLPELSITPHLLFTTGSSTLNANDTLPGLVTSYSWSITQSFSLAGGTSIVQQQDSSNLDTYNVWGQTAIGTYKISNQLSLWLEGFASMPSHSSSSDESYFADTGFLYLLTNNIQVDVRLGSQLADGFGDNLFTGIGLSARYS